MTPKPKNRKTRCPLQEWMRDYFKVDERTVRRWMKRGSVPGRGKIPGCYATQGGHYRIQPPADLEAWKGEVIGGRVMPGPSTLAAIEGAKFKVALHDYLERRSVKEWMAKERQDVKTLLEPVMRHFRAVFAGDDQTAAETLAEARDQAAASLALFGLRTAKDGRVIRIKRQGPRFGTAEMARSRGAA